MKISQDQKLKTRQKIIETAVDLIIKQGFRSATMREIARQAGIGDATIYNYFPTKEAILFAYYEDHFKTCALQLKAIENFNQYSFQEQVQTFFETSLDLFLPDREFVGESFKTIFFTMSQNYQQLDRIRREFIAVIREMMDSALAAGEIPSLVFQDLIVQMFWDFYIAVVVYWLADRSERFTDTTVLLDKSLDLASALLKAGLVNKVFDIATFLFKNHVLNRMNFIKERIDEAHAIKRQFMGATDANGNPED